MGWKDIIYKDEAKEPTVPKYRPPTNEPSMVVSSAPENVSTKSYLGGSEIRTRGRSAAVIAVSTSVPAVSSTAVDPEFDSELREALGQAQTRGYDELLEQMDLLKDVVPDESMRIQKALQSLQRMLKISPDQVVSAIRERLDLLSQARAHFDSSIQEEVRQSIDGNTQAIEDLGKQIADNEANQKRLREDYQHLVRNRDEAQRQIDTTKSESAKVRERHTNAYNFHQATLNAVLTKIQPRN